MIEKLQAVLTSLCGLEINKPVLAGVSGGADSLCLMDILVQAGYDVTVAHLNHGLRPEADAESQRVKEYARKSGVDFIETKIDVHAFRDEEHLSLEEAARIIRYRFLFSNAIEIGAQAVAVAHSADDQVETILMHLLRGAGLAGLKGMLYRTLPNSWSQEIPLVRPLLGIWRAEILEYIASRGYEPVYDASNLDVTYFRNRVRHDLIPMLESFYPGVRQRLWQTGEVLREDYLYLQAEVRTAWKACFLDAGERFIVFSRQSVQAQPKAIQRYLLKMGIETLQPGIRDLDFSTLERAQRFLYHPTRSGKIELTNGLELSHDAGRLIISDSGCVDFLGIYPSTSRGEPLDLDVPGKLQLDRGWLIQGVVIPNSTELMKQIHANSDPYQAWINHDMLLSSFKVRCRLPGDRFRPLGMGHHSMKLSDFMVNVKMPKEARAGWPLVCGTCDQGEEILWVPGYRQSDCCRVTAETNQVVWLLLVKGRLNI